MVQQFLISKKHFPNYKNDPVLNESAFHHLFCRNKNYFYLTPVGERAFEDRRRDNFRFWLPLSISAVALVLSIISICLQYA